MDLDNGGDAELDDDGYGTWDAIPGAHHYEVRLYRNDKSFSSIKSTSDTSYDFSSLIRIDNQQSFRQSLHDLHHRRMEFLASVSLERLIRLMLCQGHKSGIKNKGIACNSGLFLIRF